MKWINLDSPWAERLKSRIACERLLSCSRLDSGADYYVMEADVKTGLDLLLKTPAGNMEISSILRGAFNQYNLLFTVAAASSMGIEHEAVRKALKNVPPIPGRFEEVRCGTQEIIHSPCSSILRPCIRVYKENSLLPP